MQQRTGLRMVRIIGVLAIVLALAACTSGVAQKEYDAVKQQAASLQQQLTTKEQEAVKLQQDLQAAQAGGQQTTALQQQVAAKDKEIGDLQAKLTDIGKVTVLYGAVTQPTPTPRPATTPTAVPPGYVAPTPTPRPASLFEPVPFTVYMETLQTLSISRYGIAGTAPCNVSHTFKRGQMVVFRFEVFDTKTGKRVTDLDKATISIRLPHGEEIAARMSARAGTGPWMWSVRWDIPPDYPLGGVDYAVVVNHPDGRTFTWKEPSLVRPQTATAYAIDTKLQVIP